MNRPYVVWSVFAIGLLATISAVGWLTLAAWHADQARQQALFDSEIRNALWRMDSLAAPLLAIEINRPTISTPLTGSPSLAPRLIKGYLIQDETGTWRIRRRGDQSRSEVIGDKWMIADAEWINRIQEVGVPAAQVAAGPEVATVTSPRDLIVWPEAVIASVNNTAMRNSTNEIQNRSQLVQQFQQLAVNSQFTPPENPSPHFGHAPMQPMWVEGELVLARLSSSRPGVAGGQPVIEVCWLNWDEWKTLLEEQLQGSSIPLQLQPVAAGVDEHIRDWQMVSLPVRIVPLSSGTSGAWPLPLVAVWVLLLAVAIAFGWVMRQTLSLSERRAAFVSAVTHELRTPLTTFRLYTEILTEGLARDPEQQRQYFQTLHREANRLTLLVENVLAYARLEHGRSTARNETLTAGDLLSRCQSRLEQRVAETTLELVVTIPDWAPRVKLTTNAMAVEQILFNLIDNSCKYARGAADPRILCDVNLDGRNLCLSISDFGPGLSVAARRSLFQPFQKSSSEAAETAPGVGLGLALSHRLARDLRGSLTCLPNAPNGLRFEVKLPLAD